MEWLIFVAGLLFALCALSLTAVLLYKPKPYAPVVKEKNSQAETNEKLSYANKWKRWIPHFTKMHPDIQILFDKTALQHGVFLEGRLTKETGNTLFIFHSEETLNLFLQAVEELLENHELSVVCGDILVTDTPDGKAELELSRILHDKGKRYEMCLLDTSGIIRRDNVLFGFIGTSRKCVIHLETKDETDRIWYGKDIAVPSGLKKILPQRLCLQLCIPRYQKGIDNLVRFFPKAKEYFTSFLQIENGNATISAKDEVIAEKLLDRLRKHASSSLVLKKQVPSSPCAQEDVIGKVQGAVADSFENVIPLPVMQEEEITVCLDPFIHNKIAFAPTGIEEISHLAAVRFYHNMCLK